MYYYIKFCKWENDEELRRLGLLLCGVVFVEDMKVMDKFIGDRDMVIVEKFEWFKVKVMVEIFEWFKFKVVSKGDKFWGKVLKRVNKYMIKV